MSLSPNFLYYGEDFFVKLLITSTLVVEKECLQQNEWLITDNPSVSYAGTSYIIISTVLINGHLLISVSSSLDSV